MRISYAVFSIFLLFPLLTAYGQQLSVEVVDFQDSVLLYAPVYVTGVIKNTGSGKILVPVNDLWQKGWRYEISKGNQPLPSQPRLEGDRGTDKVILLNPGEKYFFSHNIGRFLEEEGVYELRAVLESSGKCILDVFDLNRYQPQSTEQANQQVECWAGRITSPIVKVLVSAPIVSEDIKALELLHSRQFYQEIGLPHMINSQPKLYPYDFSYAYRVLKERFPNSYYTYVAGLYYQETAASGAIGTLQELMRLQPGHPLSKYAQFQLAQAQEHFPNHPLSVAQSYLNLPPALKEYVDQIRRERHELEASGRFNSNQ